MAEGDYTYEKYCKMWLELFGDVDTADYGYYQGNTRIPYTITKLTKDAFCACLAELDRLNAEFDKAARVSDTVGMDAALVASFPHELALLL